MGKLLDRKPELGYEYAEQIQYTYVRAWFILCRCWVKIRKSVILAKFSWISSDYPCRFQRLLSVKPRFLPFISLPIH
jgi:hypothetical protein